MQYYGIVDSLGNEVVKYIYDPWGKILSTSGSLASTLGTIQPFRYRGYVYDEETGLYYLRSRYYSPNWNRFVNCDKYLNLLYNNANLIGTNLYCYCLNNIVNQTDSNGKLPQKGTVVAHGFSSEGVCFYALAIIQGTCYDSYGNEAEFVSYVGISPTGQDEHYAEGLGGIGASVSNSAMTVNADSVYDLAGKGCYIGGGIDIGLSLGLDAVFLGKYLPEINSDTKPDGYQSSYGLGIGLTWFHEGNCFTLIRVAKKDGIPVPKDEQIWEY